MKNSFLQKLQNMFVKNNETNVDDINSDVDIENISDEAFMEQIARMEHAKSIMHPF